MHFLSGLPSYGQEIDPNYTLQGIMTLTKLMEYHYKDRENKKYGHVLINRIELFSLVHIQHDFVYWILFFTI